MEHPLKYTLLILLTSPFCLFSMNGKPDKISGHYDYSVEGSTEVLKVHDKTILEYQRFNIEKNETTRYEQPSSNSTLLCRVKGRNPSTIRGKLEANGKLLFINPHGIIFSETAHVNVGTLIASTLDIQNDHFLNNRFKFELGSGDSFIVNKGRIEAAHNVVFMAPKIVNLGVISAKAGIIALLGGEKITLDFDGDQKIQFVVDEPIKNGFIEQAGQLNASQVYMKLQMAQHVIKSVLNVSGVVEAGHIEIENGVVRLKAGSSTEARDLYAAGDTLEIAGDLKVTGLCNLKAQHDIKWLKGNAVHHLNIESDRFLLGGSLSADLWTSRIAGAYILENSININDNPLVFDAPVFLNRDQISLFTGDSGRAITFQDRVEAQKAGVRLDLSAGIGDINFKKGVVLSHLNITSAHNVNTATLNVDRWTQQNVKGITTVGDVVLAMQEVTLQSYAFNLAHGITVEKGPLAFEAEGHLKSSENVTLSASSITHTGSGDVFLGGKWIARTGGITVNGMVHLLGSVEFEAPQGEILFNKGIGGLGWLDSRSQSFVIKGDIGRISYLNVDAEKYIRLANIGKGEDGILGSLHLHTKGPIFFDGTDYVAEGHDFKASRFEFNSGATITIFNPSVAPTIFKEGTVNIGKDTTLEIKSAQGPIELSSVQGADGSNLIAASPRSQLMAHGIQGVGHLSLSADEVILQNAINTESIHLAAREPIKISHLITAKIGDFIVEAPLHFTAPNSTLEALAGKLMQFGKPLTGNTALYIRAPQGEIAFKGPLEGLFKLIEVNAKTISQYKNIASTGPINFKASQINIGGDIVSKNGVIFDGPVVLFNQNVIHLTVNNFIKNKGFITFTSTLDADSPDRGITIQGQKSLTQFTGAIGQKGPLRELEIATGSVIFHDNIGGVNPGIKGRLLVTTDEVKCFGSTYYTGQQKWSTPNILLESSGAVELKTQGKPLEFAFEATLHPKNATSLGIHTNGGVLDLAQIKSDNNTAITINTGEGRAFLQKIGEKVSNLRVDGGDIILRGQLEADEIFLNALDNLEYEQESQQTAIISKGTITLNAKSGRIGAPDEQKLIYIKTTEKLIVGAKTAAYLKGFCEDQYPRAYAGNPPPRTFFNGIEYINAAPADLAEDDVLLKTLSPDLSQKIPTSFIDGSVIKPRKAPIYYDTSSK